MDASEQINSVKEHFWKCQHETALLNNGDMKTKLYKGTSQQTTSDKFKYTTCQSEEEEYLFRLTRRRQGKSSRRHRYTHVQVAASW